MSEHDLIAAWRASRWHVIVSQLGPTILLTLTTWFLLIGLDEAELPVRLAAAGVLLASGILGAVAQVSAADEGLAVVEELRALPAATPLGRRIAASARWMQVVKWVTPTIFVLIYLALLWAIFLG
ncbi:MULTISPECIES: hypothetical protein [unclassified Agromyces]|uniref:hypothetical protein n=1 Tax=unclassified Agromyces TaxID=2639701 RepID=UPI003014E01B